MRQRTVRPRVEEVCLTQLRLCATDPSGDWFGCVSNKEHLSAIVDHVHASRGEEVAPVEETASVLSAHWRGRMGMTKVEAAELAIEVAE